MARDLIKGKRDPVEVGLWASQINLPENRAYDEDLEKRDPQLREFLDTLGLAAQQGDIGKLLYGKEDYQDWLNEFMEQIKN